MRKKLVIVCIVILILVLYHFAHRPVGTSAHDLIQPMQEPVQESLQKGEASSFLKQASGYIWTITPQAKFKIAARVLSKETYRTGWQSSLSPVDLALGWGEFSDRKVDEWISWSQSGRWYYYNWPAGSPFADDQIREHSANVHIVPATENLKQAALHLSKNDTVMLEGFLINLDGKRGDQTYFWHSSLSRTDSGDGSCELLYLKRLVFEGQEYQ
jgi:hypothetical protein